MSMYEYRGTRTIDAEQAGRQASLATWGGRAYQVDRGQLAVDTVNVLKMICATQMRDVLSMRANAAHPRACCDTCGALHRADTGCDVCQLRAGKGAA